MTLRWILLDDDIQAAIGPRRFDLWFSSHDEAWVLLDHDSDETTTHRSEADAKAHAEVLA